MASYCIGVGKGFDLDLSMYPSFLSSVYSFLEPRRWVRRIGVHHTIIQLGGKLCCIGEGCSHELLYGIGGLWCWSECINSLKNTGYTWLLKLYPGLRISAALSPVDRILVSSAVILSVNTRYASNVRRWLKQVFNSIDDEQFIDKAVLNAEKLPSPQPRLLAKILPLLSRIVLEIDRFTPLEARRRLLDIKGIGPKTADAILLFTGVTSMVTPGDRHLERFARQVLGLAGRLGSKSECLRGEAWCGMCSFNKYCLQGMIVALFGKGAGFVQTVSYVYGRLGSIAWHEKLYRELEAFYKD